MSFLLRNLLKSPGNLQINQLTNSVRRLSLTSPCLIRIPQKHKDLRPPRVEAKPISPVFPLRSENDEKKGCEEVIQNVNALIEKKDEGRLFAVVQIAGKQFKVTDGDVVVVEGFWPPTTGDELRLEKVLLVGGNDFSLIGSPLVDRNLVDVKATVIEKTISHTKTHFKKKRRKQYMRINFQRPPHSMIRINSINLLGQLEKTPPHKEDPTRVY